MLLTSIRITDRGASLDSTQQAYDVHPETLQNTKKKSKATKLAAVNLVSCCVLCGGSTRRSHDLDRLFSVHDLDLSWQIYP